MNVFIIIIFLNHDVTNVININVFIILFVCDTYRFSSSKSFKAIISLKK